MVLRITKAALLMLSPCLTLMLLLLSASVAHASTSDLQSSPNAISAQACIALKYSALPDRYYDCVRQAMALGKAATNTSENNQAILLASNTTSADNLTDAQIAISLETASQGADIETAGVTIQLAQNTATEVINNGTTQTPRVISRPQPVTDENDDPGSATNQNTDTQTNVRTDMLPAWLPESAKTWLGSVLSEEQLELVGRNWLYGLLAIGALVLLPLLWSLISASVRRRRYAQTNLLAPAASNQTEGLFDDLDFGDLGIAGDETKKSDSNNNNEPDEQSQKEKSVATDELPPFTEEKLPEQSETTAPVAESTMDTAQEHDETTLLPESVHEQTDTREARAEAEEVVNTAEANTANSSRLSTNRPESGIATDSLQSSPAPAAPRIPLAAATASANQPNDLHATKEDTASQSGITEDDNTDRTLGERSPLTRFGKWLYDLPAESGKPASMEAFMYWVSYSDGNIKPGLAEELAEAEELDDHGRIKKAVLSFRPEVLDDVLLSLDKHLDQNSKKAFLDLLLAVLVKNSQPTPVQNLLFRFYADYTGMGVDQLKTKFQIAFGQELPGIPRPDRNQWWVSQIDEQGDSDSTVDVNLRTFGLDQSATTEDINAAFRLAKMRHDPKAFELLGEKEQALAARSFSKYRHSHELLTEIEA